MTKESISQTQNQREFYEAARPEEIQKFFSGIDETARALSRTSLDPSEIDFATLTPKDVDTPQKIAIIIAPIKCEDLFFKNIDTETEEGRLEAVELAAAKADSASSEATNPLVKQAFSDFSKGAVQSSPDIIAKAKATARRVFLKTVPIITLAAVTTACGLNPNVIVPPVIPDGGGTGPTATEISPTAIPSATQTEAPTATATVEAPAFMPEGFSEGPMGLLRSPETGKDTMGLNPEADWKQAREQLLGGLWTANVDWAKYTGQSNDATKYKTPEEFIAAAESGKTLHIGIPVRVDQSLLPESQLLLSQMDVVLKIVDIKLDNIQFQVLSPDAFKKYTGKGWNENGQEAYACYADTATLGGVPEGSSACLFTTDGDKLIISVGSFYMGNQVSETRSHLFGSFNPDLYKQYPTYFRPDGIGVNADKAASFLLGYATDELYNYPMGHFRKPIIGTDGKGIKGIAISRVEGVPDDKSYYLNPSLFVFSP